MTVMAAVSAASLAAAQSAGALGKGSLGGYDVASVATRAAGEAATAAESRAADVDSRVRVLEQEVDAVDDELEHWRAERERLLDQLPAQERSRALTCVAGLRERGAAQWEGIAAADAIDALAARALDAKLAAAALLGPHDRAQVSREAEQVVLRAATAAAPRSAISLASGTPGLGDRPSALLGEPAALLHAVAGMLGMDRPRAIAAAAPGAEAAPQRSPTAPALRQPPHSRRSAPRDGGRPAAAEHLRALRLVGKAPAAPSPDDSMSPFAVTPLPPGEEDSFDDDSRDVPLRSTKGSAARFKGSSSSSSSSRLAWGHETSDPRD